MQTSAFGKSKSLWITLTEGSWSEAFDGLGISLLLTSNPAIQVLKYFLVKLKGVSIVALVYRFDLIKWSLANSSNVITCEAQFLTD